MNLDEFGMWCYLHDLKIATKENHSLDQFLLSQFVVQEESWSWEVLAVSMFLIFMLS